MWHTVVGRHIRRGTRNLFWTNLLLGSGVLVLFGLSRGYWYNFACGPFEVAREEVSGLRSADDLCRYYVRVDGREIVPAGWQDIERHVNRRTGQVDRETVVAEYALLALGEKFLIVKHRAGWRPDREAVGRLITIPEAVQRDLIQPTAARHPRAAGLLLPVMLDATGFRGVGYILLAVGIPLGLFAGWNVARALVRWGDPEQHPSAWALVRYGVPAEVAEAIDAEVADAGGCVVAGRTTVTRSWLLVPTTFGLTAYHLGEAVWAYKCTTQHLANGIPTGRSYAAVCHFRDGRVAKLAVKSETLAERLVAALVRRAPWLLAGYSAELEAAWKKDRGQVLALVDGRRHELGRGPL